MVGKRNGSRIRLMQVYVGSSPQLFLPSSFSLTCLRNFVLKRFLLDTNFHESCLSVLLRSLFVWSLSLAQVSLFLILRMMRGLRHGLADIPIQGNYSISFHM